ncbi:hypothetical protein PQX77_012085 [Marasmius sp. AFHP31]|nr:hypothetical protein PQX77_012085 [Marasmius sp. AFHP31]
MQHNPQAAVAPQAPNGLGADCTFPPYATVQIPSQSFVPLLAHQFVQPSVQLPSKSSSRFSSHIPSAFEIQTSTSLLLAYASSSPPSIPSTTTIPILQGQDNFMQWHEAATGMIQNLGLNSWICGPTPENIVHYNPNVVPVYPPVLSYNPLPEDYQVWQVFWAWDGTASVVLTSRLSPSVVAMLPPNIDPLSGAQRTSRDILNIIRD